MFCIFPFSDSIAFATEPIVGSLANFLGNYDRAPTPIPSEIKVTSPLIRNVALGIS